jgi:beta-galactosidase
VVPDATNAISFKVSGGRLVGLDNGRQESAENYKSSTRAAWAGKALAMIQAGTRAGPVTITARSPGLRTGEARVRSVSADRNGFGSADPVPVTNPSPPSTVDGPVADAGYSGAPDTLPAAMLDGDPATGWSNFYRKAATALLPTISSAHAREWVSLTYPRARTLSGATASFTVDATHALPAAIEVRYWDGTRYLPVGNPRITWAPGSDQPTAITFDPVRTNVIRLELTSAAPSTTSGFLRIVALAAS